MPPAPVALEAEAGAHDQAGTIDAPAPAPLTTGPGCGKPQVLPFRRRAPGLLRRAPKIARSYRDPLFERPDLVESDYRLLQNHPRD